MKTIKEIRLAIKQEKVRGAWANGVKEYAIELLEEMGEDQTLSGDKLDHDTLLNGAPNWNQYSWGGCSLIYDEDIAKRLCPPSELKRTRDGERKPNANEEWLDVQGRALRQAERMVLRIAKG